MKPGEHPKFTVIRTLFDGMTEIRDGSGRLRRVQMISCVECQTSLPDFAFFVWSSGGRPRAMCGPCQADIKQRDLQEWRRDLHKTRYENGDLPHQRRASILALASPPWRDKAAIRAIYAEARRITAETGVPHHVDHFYPLQGKLCCGLHVHQNLKIVTAAANLSKRNRMPVEA